jgi:hypothetical protein
MPADRTYSDHLSIHDTETARKLGLRGAPIEGPTLFSQFEPLAAALWDERWFSHGCISAHFLNMVVEGEQVQATVTSPGPGAELVRIDSAKTDGTPVLTGTASVNGDRESTALASRLARAQENPPSDPIILDRLEVGQIGATTSAVVTDPDHLYGALYPFTLRQKLAIITESLTWHDPEVGTASPWGAAVVPMEMLSVLVHSGSLDSGFEVRQPSVGLFIDLEVRALGHPVLIDRRYRVSREIVALSESRRTESFWTRCTLIDDETDEPTAEVLVHSGVLKDSYPGYPADRIG